MVLGVLNVFFSGICRRPQGILCTFLVAGLTRSSYSPTILAAVAAVIDCVQSIAAFIGAVQGVCEGNMAVGAGLTYMTNMQRLHCVLVGLPCSQDTSE